MPEVGITEVFNKIKEPEHFFDYLSSETVRQILERIVSRIIIYKDKMVIRLLPFGAMLLELSKQHKLQASEDAPGFFNAAGIESPGLSSAPAIGEYLADMIASKLALNKKENFKRI